MCALQKSLLYILSFWNAYFQNNDNNEFHSEVSAVSAECIGFSCPEIGCGAEGFMKNPCATCGGTGQIGYFQGESRFLLTWKECPRCCGTGTNESQADVQEKNEIQGTGVRKPSAGKRRKK
jgi:DnaJ-class molecular chaperone